MADTESGVGERPNVVLCMTDDQGWGDVGYNGHSHLSTPNIDAMAEEGVRFDRFYAAAPVCSPTRGSCLTGRHPFRYGIVHANEGHLPDEETTLAELLRERGYATGHFGKWHLGTLSDVVRESNRGGIRGAQHYAPPWERGFEECFSTEASLPTWDPMVTPQIAADHGWVEPERVGDSYGTYYWTGPGEIATENLAGDDSRVLMDRAVSFVREAVRDDRPFLAVVWFHTPHTPVVAGEEYRGRYGQRPVSEQHYYGALSAVDDQIGRLREELAALGVAEETMLWFTSDNGPSGYDSPRTRGATGGLRGGKDTLYEGGIRVPGTLVWPDGPDGPESVETSCVTSDYLPTVLDAVGVEAPERPLDGVSLLPLIAGERDRRPEPIGFEHSEDSVAWIDGDEKLVRHGDDAEAELYDLAADPRETTDRSAERPERVASMEDALAAWRDSCSQSSAGADYA
jgi:arylsulfatase A-like enzyme